MPTGHVLLSFNARSSAPSAFMDLWVNGDAGQIVAAPRVPIPPGAAWATTGAWVALPPTAQTAYLRMDVLSPDAGVDLAWVSATWEP